MFHNAPGFNVLVKFYLVMYSVITKRSKKNGNERFKYYKWRWKT